MKIGWCGTLDDAGLMRDLGLDFIELPLFPFGLEDPQTFAAAKQAVARSPLPALAFNFFFPRDMSLVGPDIDERRIRNYLARAAELLAVAQAQVIVLGSGRSRNIPDGFERARAEDQFQQLLSWCADALESSTATLAIEPLNRKESNFINSVADGVKLAQAVAHPKIRMLADFYHMDEEREPLETLKVNGGWLTHIHLADTGRRNPGSGYYDYDTFFARLKEAGYAGMVCAECKIERREAEMRSSLQFLKRYCA